MDRNGQEEDQRIEDGNINRYYFVALLIYLFKKLYKRIKL